MTNEEKLQEMILQTKLAIEAEQLVANHFRPQYMASLEKHESTLRLLSLYPYVIEKERNVRRLEEELKFFESLLPSE